MARGGTNCKESALSIDDAQGDFEYAHETARQMAELARISDRFLDPNGPAPGVIDPDASAAAERIQAMDDAVLREKLSGGLVIDLDDTLTTNVPLFHQSRWLMTPIYAEASGRDDLLQIMEEREAVCQRLLPEYGFTPKRWRMACETYLHEVAPDHDEATRERLMAACEVALGVGEFYAGCEATLAKLHQAGVPMLLLTKGEKDKQAEKIAAHGMERFFGHIQIVDHKEAQVLADAAASAGLAAPVVIGDSAASDIAPATAAGLDSIHVDRGSGATWAAEHHDGAHHAEKAPSFPQAIEALLS
jgi:FMN phosphatase YigB (HAD superfamily)